MAQEALFIVQHIFAINQNNVKAQSSPTVLLGFISRTRDTTIKSRTISWLQGGLLCGLTCQASWRGCLRRSATGSPGASHYKHKLSGSNLAITVTTTCCALILIMFQFLVEFLEFSVSFYVQLVSATKQAGKHNDFNQRHYCYGFWLAVQLYVLTGDVWKVVVVWNLQCTVHLKRSVFPTLCPNNIYKCARSQRAVRV